jgi:uncharacterized protein YecT (DUF1311 family)
MALKQSNRCVMGRKFATYLGVFLAAGVSTYAAAQNPNAFMNMFGAMMRAAIIDHARTEWSKVPPNEISCVEQALQQRGYSVDSLVQNGIAPEDPRVFDIRSDCRVSPVPLPSRSNNNVGSIGDISDRPTFDCTKAKSATGRILCVGKEGAKADWDLTSAYWARYFTLDETARDGFSRAEEDWFPSLNRTCRLLRTQDTFSPAQRQCVYTAYETRAALFRSQLSGDALAESELTPEQHAQIQAELIRRGILDDTADGEFGENTRNAIKTLQAQSGVPTTGFLTAQEIRQLLPTGQSQAQNCKVADPTGTPLNIRRSPDGDVIGTVDNGLSVQIVQTLQDDRGRYWSSIERASNHETLGWVFRNYIT